MGKEDCALQIMNLTMTFHRFRCSASNIYVNTFGPLTCPWHWHWFNYRVLMCLCRPAVQPAGHSGGRQGQQALHCLLLHPQYCCEAPIAQWQDLFLLHSINLALNPLSTSPGSWQSFHAGNFKWTQTVIFAFGFLFISQVLMHSFNNYPKYFISVEITTISPAYAVSFYVTAIHHQIRQ